MAQAIIIGGITVPIVRTYHFPNQANPTAVPGISTTPFEVWSDSVTYARASYGPSSGQSDSFGDSNLDIHDNAYVEFKEEVLQPDIYMPGLVIRVKTYRNGAQASLPGFILGDFSVYPGTRGDPSYVTTYETRLGAIMFDFPDATNPLWRVPNFYIYNVQGKVIYREDGSIRETDYPYTRLLFNFAYANYYNNQYTMYLTPIDIPDHDNDPNEQDPDYPSEPSDPDGHYERDYDPIPIPPKPTQGAATAGFITLYKLHQASMSQFASDCFASTLWEALKLFFSNPMDFLVGVNLLPFEPTAGGSFTPKFGAVSFAHAYPVVANQYVDVPCGSIEIKKYWGNCFDFEPYTKIQIWLPYIGYRDLPVDEIMGMTISVKYRCDCLTGDCVAFVYTGVVGETGPQVERVIAQFYGNCAVRVPFGSVSYDSAISNSIALMGAAASAGLGPGVGAMMETGGAAGGIMAGAEAAADAINTNAGASVRASSVGVVQGMKPTVHKGGAAGASTGYMSIQVPYIIRRIPRQSLPEGYVGLKGYPSNIGGKLADFTGLAVVDDIQLNNIPALEDERKEIINWLRGGVLI